MTFSPDKSGGEALFLQLADWLEERMACGELAAGERLPAERLLAGELDIARATVKNAYAELVRRNLAETRVGSGTYALGLSPERGREEAARASRMAVAELRAAGLSRREIETLVREKLWERLPEGGRPRVAFVDCSPELLCPMAAELARECGVGVTPHLVWEAAANPELLLAPRYDAIVTTIMHYEELMTVPALQALRYETAVLSLTRETVAAVAQVPCSPGTRIAALYATQQFREIIERYLGEFGVRAPCDYYSLAEGPERFFETMQRYAAIILPPDPDYRRDVLDEARRRCASQGVKAIPFTHRFDEGSLIHLRGRVQEIWTQNGRIGR